MPMSPQQQAIVTGVQQGTQAGQSILPNSYQPQGKAVARNVFEGVLTNMVADMMQVAAGIGNQGDMFREEKQQMLKLAYELQKLNNRLTKLAQDGETPNA